MSELREELKPCPFCGGEAAEFGHDEHESAVGCILCGISTLLVISHNADPKIEATQTWNRRALLAGTPAEGGPGDEVAPSLVASEGSEPPILIGINRDGSPRLTGGSEPEERERALLALCDELVICGAEFEMVCSGDEDALIRAAIAEIKQKILTVAHAATGERA